MNEPEPIGPIAARILDALRPDWRTVKHLTAHRTVDVRLAEPGWTIHFLDAHGNHSTRHLVGWVLRDEHDLNRDGDFVTYTDTVPYRHICAGYIADGHIEAVDDDPDFWYVAAPDDPEPTTAQINDALKERRATAERRRWLAAGHTPAA